MAKSHENVYTHARFSGAYQSPLVVRCGQAVGLQSIDPIVVSHACCAQGTMIKAGGGGCWTKLELKDC